MTDEILDQASQAEIGTGVNQRSSRWVLWLQWVVVNAVGVAFLVWARGQRPGGPVAWAMIGLGAACMVLAQWLVLWPRLARAGWWLLVTPVGLALGGLAALFAIYIAGEYYGQWGVVLGLLATLLVGTPVGFLQWLVLRRQARRALWWLPVTVGAIDASLLALWLCLMVFAELPAALAGFVLGAVYGAITGAALAVLLPHPAQTRDRKPSLSRLAVGIALLSLLVICLGWGILVEPLNVRHMLIQYRLGKRDFGGISLEGADLSRADLSQADLGGANLSQTDLSGANLEGANLAGANLYKANLSQVDLREFDLREFDLGGANLSQTDLSGANLSGFHLSGADLSGADLSEADLSGADLLSADLSEAELGGANLSRANLWKANLSEANLHEADLSLRRDG